MSTRRRRDEIAFELGYRGPRGGMSGAGDVRIAAQKTPEYERFLREAMKGGESSAQLRRASSDFARQYAAAYRQGFRETKRGAFHKLLTTIGLRDPGADYPIGQSPKRRR